MSVFKLGKRVGLFDISGGISRGDFESSAYHKTDKILESNNVLILTTP